MFPQPSSNMNVLIATLSLMKRLIRCALVLGLFTSVFSFESVGADDGKLVIVPQREWKDNQGRSILASVEGLENGQVKFVRADGRQFAFPSAELSDGDRVLLEKLAASAPPYLAGSTPGEFSEWLAPADFELKHQVEGDKGLYAIFVEGNEKDQLRGIFEKRPEGMKRYYSWFAAEAALKELNAEYQKKNYTLLTLSYNRRSKTYNGLWVENKSLESARVQLVRHRISMAAIGDGITFSRVAVR